MRGDGRLGEWGVALHERQDVLGECFYAGVLVYQVLRNAFRDARSGWSQRAYNTAAENGGA